MADKVDNKNSDYRRNDYRPGQAGLDRGKLLVPSKTTEKSTFQKVMDETGQASETLPFNPSSDTTPTATKDAVRFAASQQERYGKDRDDPQKKIAGKDDDHDEPARTGDSRDSSAPRAKEAERRVIGRGSTSGRRDEKGGEGGQQGGGGTGTRQGQQRGKGFLGLPGGEYQGVGRTDPKGVIHGSFEMELHAAQSLAATAPAKPAKTPNILSKTVLDQIVQYCRIVTKTDGDKELEMQLHEAVFKGLRLRVSFTEGKMDATFVTQSDEVRNLFNAQKNELKKALAEKGIEVKTINVILA